MAEFKVIGIVPQEFNFTQKASPVGFIEGDKLSLYIAMNPCAYCSSDGIIPVYESDSSSDISFETYCVDCIYQEVPEGYKKYKPEAGENGLCPN